MNKYKNISIAIFIFSIAASVRLIVAAGGYYVDDAFIALRIARNFSEYSQLVFNVGEYIQTGTSNLYLVLLGSAYKFYGENSLVIFRYLGALVDSISAVVIFFILINFSRGNSPQSRNEYLLAGVVAGVLYALIPTAAIPAVAGLETSFFTLCLVSFFYVLQKKDANIFLLIILAILCALLRPEGGIIALITYVNIASRYFKGNKNILPVLIILPIIGVCYELFLYLYFGSIIPQTATAKMLVKSLTIGSQPTWLDYFGPLYLSIVAMPIGIMSFLGMFNILKERRDLLWYLFWYVAYVSIISIFSLWWTWYKTPAITFYSISVGLGVYGIKRFLGKKIDSDKLSKVMLAISMGVILGVGIKCYQSIDSLNLSYNTPFSDQKITELDEVINWVNINVPINEEIMLEPLGYFGYHVRHKILDYPGLASREVTNSMKGILIPKIPADHAYSYSIVVEKVMPKWLILYADEYNKMKEINGLKEYLIEYKSSHGLYLILNRKGK